ncbi:MAG TPA: hypothetical protein VMS71_07750 [Candidatus Acidoferrum sp.]|nr:hypothetical protein [Candidatus Acidoferrum sp.]
MKKRNLAVSSWLLVALLLACGGPKTLVTYEGPRQTVDRVAILTTSESAIITRIDNFGKKHIGITADSIEVLPGEHAVEVNYRSWKGSSNQPVILTFNAEAGRVYRVEAEAGYRQWTAKIIDISTGATVSR